MLHTAPDQIFNAPVVLKHKPVAADRKSTVWLCINNKALFLRESSSRLEPNPFMSALNAPLNNAHNLKHSARS